MIVMKNNQMRKRKIRQLKSKHSKKEKLILSIKMVKLSNMALQKKEIKQDILIGTVTTWIPTV